MWFPLGKEAELSKKTFSTTSTLRQVTGIPSALGFLAYAENYDTIAVPAVGGPVAHSPPSPLFPLSPPLSSPSSPTAEDRVEQISGFKLVIVRTMTESGEIIYYYICTYIFYCMCHLF